MKRLKEGAVVRPNNEWWATDADAGRGTLSRDMRGIVIKVYPNGALYYDLYKIAFPGFPDENLAGSELDVFEEDQPVLNTTEFKKMQNVDFGETVDIDGGSKFVVATISKLLGKEYVILDSEDRRDRIKAGRNALVRVHTTKRLDPWKEV